MVFALDKRNASFSAVVEGDEIVLQVHCAADAGALEHEVPYGLTITLEVAVETGPPIYEEVRARIRTTAPVRHIN